MAHVRRSKTSFPLSISAACECGCGWEGEDTVTRYCVEEAANLAYDHYLEAVEAEEEAAARDEAKPGEITDPVMAQAMAEAKRIHFEATGVRT